MDELLPPLTSKKQPIMTPGFWEFGLAVGRSLSTVSTVNKPIPITAEAGRRD